jgi:hypothetical protein
MTRIENIMLYDLINEVSIYIAMKFSSIEMQGNIVYLDQLLLQKLQSLVKDYNDYGY